MPPFALIVEDNTVACKLAQRLTQKILGSSYDIKTASNSRDAIEILSQPNLWPEVILLDQDMPGGNGEDLIQWLAEHQKCHPTKKANVIFCSGEESGNQLLQETWESCL